jgi:hypothetical protein
MPVQIIEEPVNKAVKEGVKSQALLPLLPISPPGSSLADLAATAMASTAQVQLKW